MCLGDAVWNHGIHSNWGQATWPQSILLRHGVSFIIMILYNDNDELV